MRPEEWDAYHRAIDGDDLRDERKARRSLDSAGVNRQEENMTKPVTIHDHQNPEELFSYSQITEAIIATLKRREFKDSGDETRETAVRVLEAFVGALPCRCPNCGGSTRLPV